MDDGQSLCYIESESPSSQPSEALQESDAVNVQRLSLLQPVLPSENNDFTISEGDCAASVHNWYNEHHETQSGLADDSFAYPGLQSISGTVSELSPVHEFGEPASQPVQNDDTWFNPLGSPSSVSVDGLSSRKRSYEVAHGRANDGNKLESRRRRPRQKQVILRPAMKINTMDQCLLSPLANINLVMGFNTRLPNSRFDGYIHALRQLIRCSAEKSSLGNNLKRALTAEGVLWVVRESWPAAEGYWNLTATFKGFLHAELWRNFPCERTYKQLPPEYRPTRAQLMVPHSPMIDWMPWPDLRDLAIRYQDEIDTDELFRMAILNVVAHRKKLAECSPISPTSSPDKKSFRVWDLVCLEKLNGVDPLADPGLTRKPVLHSPSARALVRAFDLEYDEFATQKLDDCFFDAFPTLYCDTAASSWTVEAFPTILPEDVGYPVDLTSSAVHRLKSKFESMIGSVIEV